MSDLGNLAMLAGGPGWSGRATEGARVGQLLPDRG